MSHTPGPWVRDKYGNIKAGCQTLRVNGVSLPCGAKPHDFEEIEANSNLIAAAPDLLAALKNLYAMVQGQCPSLLENDHHNEMVYGAIAKAEGR